MEPGLAEITALVLAAHGRGGDLFGGPTSREALALAALLIRAALAAWHGLLRIGPARVAGLGVADVLGLVAALIVATRGYLELVLIGSPKPG